MITRSMKSKSLKGGGLEIVNLPMFEKIVEIDRYVTFLIVRLR